MSRTLILDEDNPHPPQRKMGITHLSPWQREKQARAFLRKKPRRKVRKKG